MRVALLWAAAVLPGWAAAQDRVLPVLTLESLPRPPAPPLETSPVVPSQVLRWRQEAQALEHGDHGVPRDPVRAAQLYCRAARHGDAEAQYSLAWMLTNARGIERDDAQAAHLFTAAAEQGHVQAQNMARTLGTPLGAPPDCLKSPEQELLAAAAAAALRPATPSTRAAAVFPPGSVHAAPDGPIPPNAPEPIVRFVKLLAPEYKLSASLVLAVMATESNFNPLAVSAKNAQGLMQLIPETALRFKVRKIDDPAQNIRGGMAYLRWLLDRFDGNLALALAGYNAGEGAVERYRGVPPYAETQRYVLKILTALDAWAIRTPSAAHPAQVGNSPRFGAAVLSRQP